VCLVLGITLGVAQNKARSRESFDVTTRIIGPLINAPAGAIHRSLNNSSDFLYGMRSSGALTAEVKRLRAMEGAARLYQERLDIANQDLAAARKLIGASSQGHEKVPARIVGYAPYESRITLSAGLDRGVSAGQAVITGDGLLAVVQSVGPSTCQANLLTSPKQTVGAVAVGYNGGTSSDTRILGLVKGDTETTLLMETTNTTQEVSENAKVFTSGISNTIPGGLYIGFVLEKTSKSEFGQSVIKVRINAELSSAREVYILK